MLDETKLRHPSPVPRLRILKATLIAWLVGSAIEAAALVGYFVITHRVEGSEFSGVVYFFVSILSWSAIPVLIVALLTYGVVGWLLETDRGFPEIAGLIVIPSAAITFLLPLVLFPFSIELVTGLFYFVTASLPYSVCTAYVIVRSERSGRDGSDLRGAL